MEPIHTKVQKTKMSLSEHCRIDVYIPELHHGHQSTRDTDGFSCDADDPEDPWNEESVRLSCRTHRSKNQQRVSPRRPRRVDGHAMPELIEVCTKSLFLLPRAPPVLSEQPRAVTIHSLTEMFQAPVSRRSE